MIIHVAGAEIRGPDITAEGVRMIRGVLGLTASELASRLGVTPSTVIKWETGSNPVSRRALSGLLALTGSEEWCERVRALEDLDAALAECRDWMEKLTAENVAEMRDQSQSQTKKS